MQHLICVAVLCLFLTKTANTANVVKVDLTSTNNTNSSSSGKVYEQTSNEIVLILKPKSTKNNLEYVLKNYDGLKLEKKVNIAGKEVYVIKANHDINVDKGSETLNRLDNEEMVEKCALETKYSRSTTVHYMERYTHYTRHRHHSLDFDLKEIEDEIFWNLNGKRKPSQGIAYAWKKGFTGKGSTVGIVDQYLQANHTDLLHQVRSDIGYNFVGRIKSTYPPVAFAYHGTAVTGVMIAQPRNNNCTVGISYDATAVGITVIGRSGSFIIYDASLAQWWSHGNDYIDIYSNSWGPSFPAGYTARDFFLTRQVIETASKEGRNGKGIMYAMAAGNSGPIDNCNADALKNMIQMIAVQSVTTKGPAEYAQAGSSIFCSAYGGDFSNFQRRDLIFILNPYSRCNLLGAGTSYAAPTVVGSIALALEANPHLTWRCIHHLLVRTSKRHKLRDPLKDYYWQKNGAGYYTHCRMGFGLIDAGDLVHQAKYWKKVPKQEQCSVEKHVSLSTSNCKFSDDKLTIHHSSDEHCRKVKHLEHVLVNITYYYSAKRGSIVLKLYSPSGTKSCIMTSRPYDSRVFPGSGTLQWEYKSLQFWGENPEGTWKLEFGSVDSDVTVKLLHWGLKLYGTTEPPQPHDYDYSQHKNREYYESQQQYRPNYGPKHKTNYDEKHRPKYDGKHRQNYDEKHRPNNEPKHDKY